MAGGLLDIPEGNAGVKGAGDERVPEAVRADPLGDSGPTGKPLDRPIGGVAVHPAALGPEEDRPHRSLADIEVDRPGGAGSQGDGHVLAALAHDLERAVSALEVEVVDVGAQGLRDPKPVEGQQRRQGMVAGLAQAGLDEEGAQLVAVEAEGAGFVVDLGTADVAAGLRLMSPSCSQ